MRTAFALIAVSLGFALLTACSTERSVTDPVDVTADDGGCALAREDIATGRVTFQVINRGQRVTEFYVYAPGNRVLGEVEDIAPGQSRPLEVALDGPGTYEVSCRPGMTGRDFRSVFRASAPS